MSELVEVRNADSCVHTVPGYGQAEPGQTLRVPAQVAEELMASPAKANPANRAWEAVETPKPKRAGRREEPAAPAPEEDDHVA